MRFRGSFKGAIHNMADQFRNGTEQFLSIVLYPRGKYYTVFTDEQMKNIDPEKEVDDVRLVCTLSRTELQTIGTPDQLKLNIENITNDNQTTI